ncbi:hypothetical protein HYALB_00004028 [Hymenoscyphus albidus]|uniref:O-acyltransferase n=1 Tax=Hymenoscyphus albidus TaxID=595503 RepID=A0A9N9M2V7_9HELO|nr:hypothetical protein HYALB_00004028 [Hymenoscyphus albidus]
MMGRTVSKKPKAATNPSSSLDEDNAKSTALSKSDSYDSYPKVEATSTSANSRRPRALKIALDEFAPRGTPESGSEEDYDALKPDPSAIAVGGKGGGYEGIKDVKTSLHQDKDKLPAKRKGIFSDIVFTRSFSTLDGRNPATAESPFRGFFNLFWLSVAFFMLQLFIENWQNYGSVLGGNEIMKIAFRRDVVVLLFSSAAMCLSLLFGLFLQKAILNGYVTWNGAGWIIQSVWEIFFLVAVIGWTVFRSWPWSHSIAYTLQRRPNKSISCCSLSLAYKTPRNTPRQLRFLFGKSLGELVHPASNNGNLSEAHLMRQKLIHSLEALSKISPVTSPSSTSPTVSSLSTSYLDTRPTASDLIQRRQALKDNSNTNTTSTISQVLTAISSGDPLDTDQIHAFTRIINWEISILNEDLKGKCTNTTNYYPKNLTVTNLLDFTVIPTLVYELEYPRSETIDWGYAFEKGVATLGIIAIMNTLAQARIYPVVVRAVELRETLPVGERLKEFPLILNDLVFPFIMEYLLTWYLIWECVLNFLAELTCFADRGFCNAWWNAASFENYARDWNRPVHLFLLRHVYNSSISTFKVTKYTATFITFFLSAILHEMLMVILFHRVRGYLLIMQLCQLPLIRFSRTRFMRKRPTSGNVLLWVGLLTGPGLLCSLYLII